MKVAVVGATGMVGEVMLRVLAERQFPIDELLLVASATVNWKADRACWSDLCCDWFGAGRNRKTGSGYFFSWG